MINLDQSPQQRRPGMPSQAGAPPQSAGPGGPGAPQPSGAAVLFQPQAGQPGQPGQQAPPAGAMPPAAQPPQPGPAGAPGTGPSVPPVLQQFQQDAANQMELNSIVSEQEERLASLRRYIGKGSEQRPAAGQSAAGGSVPYAKAVQKTKR